MTQKRVTDKELAKLVVAGKKDGRKIGQILGPYYESNLTFYVKELAKIIKSETGLNVQISKGSLDGFKLEFLSKSKVSLGWMNVYAYKGKFNVRGESAGAFMGAFGKFIKEAFNNKFPETDEWHLSKLIWKMK